MADRESRTDTRYDPPEVQKFVQDLHVPHDEAAQRAFDCPDRLGIPAIQVGISESKTLALLLKMIGARKVVEIGTLAGYSAIQMARALPPGGKLWTLESNPHHAQVARENAAAAGLSDTIEVIEGAALDVLGTLDPHGPFDAVFIDADKVNYDGYGRWAAAHVRPGGLLLGDNAFFFGNLMKDTPEAAGMRRFHQESREYFDTVCVPTPDGLLLGIRKG